MNNPQKVKITDTILRDAHQSRMATRMSTEDMLPVAKQINAAGFWALEMWGGATFDSSLRFLKECPWIRIRRLREYMPNPHFLMLLRGQNILGYKHYPDDVLTAFIKATVDNGVNMIRVFDALNDVRNMELAIRTTKAVGGHAQACVVYTISPVHDIDHYVDTAVQLQRMGADTLCIKDMAGILTPYRGYDLVRAMKKAIDIPIHIHCHMTAGMAAIAYIKCVEAGAEIIDTCMSAFAGGTAQPATETLVAAFENTPYDTGIDLEPLEEINNHFKQVRERYSDFFTQAETDARCLIYQVPGGMLSNLRAQMNAQGMLDRWEDVLTEVPRVREELGYPPLVTPMSQIVGTQAVFNVATGERYAIKSKEIRDYVRGMYGRPPGEISDEVRRKVIGDEEVLTGRPADLLEPGMEPAREAIKQYIRKPEDVLSYALFPQQALEYFKHRETHGE